MDVVLEALPITLLLNLTAIPIVYLVAITTGIYAAKHRGKLFDVVLPRCNRVIVLHAADIKNDIPELRLATFCR